MAQTRTLRAKNKMELETRIKGDLDSGTFAYHPKIQERLQQALTLEQKKLETCDLGNLADTQAMVKALRLMIALPEKILTEERLKKERG